MFDHSDKYISFMASKKSFNSLSNFYTCDVVIENRLYESGEHCFHGEKFYRIGTKFENKEMIEYSNSFVKPSPYLTSLDAKRAGGKKGYKLSDDEIKYWDSINTSIQYEICLYKVNKYEEVLSDLTETHNKVIVHSISRCSDNMLAKQKWAGRVLHTAKFEILGQNILGKLWMQIRKEFLKKISII